MGARVARIVVRFCMNMLGVFVVLFLTATNFNGTELSALLFIALWFGLVEAAAALAGVAPSRDGRADFLTCLLVVVPVLVVSGTVRHCSGTDVTVSAARRIEPMPRYEAALERLRERLHG